MEAGGQEAGAAEETQGGFADVEFEQTVEELGLAGESDEDEGAQAGRAIEQ